MKFRKLLLESFNVLYRNPKLFLPKLIVAAVYSIGLLLMAFLLIKSLLLILSASTGMLSAEQLSLMPALFVLSLFALAFSIFSLVLDILVNAMYPVLVSDYRKKKKLSLKRAFGFALGKSLRIIPLMLVVVISISFLLLAVFNFLIEFHSISMELFVVLFLVVSFILIVFLYMFYPVVMLEDVSALKGLKRSFLMGKQNFLLVSKASTIPFILSIASAAIAFFVYFNVFFLVLFVGLRFIIALFYTYHMVLNPTLYFSVQKVSE